jgi:hypothetical protein
MALMHEKSRRKEMGKKIYMVFFLLGLSAALYAQSPLSSVNRDGSSWEEQEGYAIVNGTRLHYWLYNTYEYHEGDASGLFPLFHQWAEKLGWVIDYENTQISSPNTSLAQSVKMLMAARNCDISVTLFESNGRTVLIINNWDWSQTGDDAYSTLIFPLLK